MCIKTDRRAHVGAVQVKRTSTIRECGDVRQEQGPGAGAAARGEHHSDGAASRVSETVAPSALRRCSVCGECQPVAAYGGWVCARALGHRESIFTRDARRCAGEARHIAGRYDQTCSACGALVLP